MGFTLITLFDEGGGVLQTVQKKYDVELPPLPPKVYKNPRYYQFRNNIRIQHELTTKKSKRNCDTKQQTEALSQPLSFCQKIWWSTCVKLKKKKRKNKLFEFDCVTN